MKEALEEELREEERKTEGRSGGGGGGREKRQIVEFTISTHLKWDRVIPYKFDGRHSKFKHKSVLHCPQFVSTQC